MLKFFKLFGSILNYLDQKIFVEIFELIELLANTIDVLDNQVEGMLLDVDQIELIGHRQYVDHIVVGDVRFEIMLARYHQAIVGEAKETRSRVQIECMLGGHVCSAIVDVAQQALKFVRRWNYALADSNHHLVVHRWVSIVDCIEIAGASHEDCSMCGHFNATLHLQSGITELATLEEGSHILLQTCSNVIIGIVVGQTKRLNGIVPLGLVMIAHKRRQHCSLFTILSMDMYLATSHDFGEQVSRQLFEFGGHHQMSVVGVLQDDFHANVLWVR